MPSASTTFEFSKSSRSIRSEGPCQSLASSRSVDTGVIGSNRHNAFASAPISLATAAGCRICHVATRSCDSSAANRPVAVQ